MTVLITGFEPFGGESVNPSWLTVHRLSGQRIHGHDIVDACLPTAFNTSLAQLAVLIEQYRPDLVIALGQAGGRSGISLERIAINIDDARIPDNLGVQPIDQVIIKGAPAAYFSTLPIKAALKNLQDSGVQAEISNTAGTYVCNHVFFGLMHLCRLYPQMRAGFVHIPFLPEQALEKQNMPSMALEELVQGLSIIVKTCLETTVDIRINAGTEC
jgi:pyroglutamyl-peptidase